MSNNYFNEEEMTRILTEFPLLKGLLQLGLLSRRNCKDALGITKWEMDDLYTDMLKACGIKVLSSSAFRAVPETLALIEKLDARK